MNQKNKKIKIIIALLVLLLVIIIAIFIGAQKSIDDSENSGKNGYSDEQYVPSVSYKENENKYQPSVINTEYAKLTSGDRKTVDEMIDWLVKSINKKSYEEFYEKLTYDYKMIRFPTLEDFSEFLDKKFPNGCSFSSFKVATHSCVVTVLPNESNDSADGFNVYFQGYEESSFMADAIYFEDIIRLEKADGRMSTDEILAEFKYMLEYKEKTVAYLEIKNKIDREITIDFKDSELIRIYAGREKKYGLIEDSKKVIKPGETVKLDLAFDFLGNGIKADTIRCIFTIDDKEYQREILVEYDDGLGYS